MDGVGGVWGGGKAARQSRHDTMEAWHVKVGQSKLDMFHVRKNVRQGCTLSPWLFNVYIDNLTREEKQHFTSGLKLSSGELEVLLFADDMVLLADPIERGLRAI